MFRWVAAAVLVLGLVGFQITDAMNEQEELEFLIDRVLKELTEDKKSEVDIAATKRISGGLSGPLKANDEIQGYVDQVKYMAEAAVGRSFEKFEAKLYRYQIVAGINYFVKVDTGDGKFVHVRLYKSLQGEVELNSIQDGKTETDKLEYFK
ncbi:cystatin-A-like [Patiria miniata]|uniref:Cystatin domain-containing protein n=1 Tax=Patiria miniata TaxID=46514 RepID=A0A914B4S5_PATMI|nr:cystatin-A-like [Patiria miniata]